MLNNLLTEETSLLLVCLSTVEHTVSNLITEQTLVNFLFAVVEHTVSNLIKGQRNI